jgi:hypothetical protein
MEEDMVVFFEDNHDRDKRWHQKRKIFDQLPTWLAWIARNETIQQKRIAETIQAGLN